MHVHYQFKAFSNHYIKQKQFLYDELILLSNDVTVWEARIWEVTGQHFGVSGISGSRFSVLSDGHCVRMQIHSSLVFTTLSSLLYYTYIHTYGQFSNHQLN